MLLLLSLTNLSIYVWISKAFEQSSKLSNPDLTKILFPLNQQIIPTKLKDNSHQKTLPIKRLFPPKDKGLQLCDFSSRLAPTVVLNGGSGGGYPKSGPKLNFNGSGAS